MRFDELYLIALISSGISLTFLNIESLKERKPGAILQLLTILSTIMFTIPQMMISCSFYNNQKITMYLNIVTSVADYLAVVTLGFLYMYRLQAFSFISNTYSIRFVYPLLIIPILYGIVDILSIAIGVGYNFSLEKYHLVYHVVNMTMAFYLTIMDIYLCFVLLKLKQQYSIQVSTTLILAPFAGSILYMCVSIWGAIDSTVGFGPLYAAWSIDVLAFQYTTSNITKVLNRPELVRSYSEE
ncbi:hypothetical protein BC833DRAFT_567297 [Globomyces pollinis-pini]|nr:hypothetical protein BC833DRAFT_567297 [Globomyces pollinis-pini]